MTGQRNISGMQTPKRMRLRRNRLFQNPYPGAQSNPSVSPKKGEDKAEIKTAKPEQVIQMPQPEKSPDEEQFSMFDLMGGMAG